MDRFERKIYFEKALFGMEGIQWNVDIIISLIDQHAVPLTEGTSTDILTTDPDIVT